MTETKNVNEMLQIRFDKLESLKAAGKDPHKIENYENRTFSADIKRDYEQYEGRKVRVAGRIMSKRGHGKVNFMDVQDATGRIQLFNRLNTLGEEGYEEVKKLDIGEIGRAHV